eukprot:63093_1
MGSTHFHESLGGSVLGGISAIICTVFFVMLFRRVSTNSEVIKKDIIYLKFGSIGCFALSMLFFTISNALNVTHSNWMLVLIPAVLYLLLYSISQVLIYWLLILRIHHVFDGTQYASSKCTYTVFMVMLILFFICSMVGVVEDTLEYDHTTYSTSDNLYNLESMYSFGVESLDFSITAFLMTLFITKLLMVTTDLQDNKSHLFVDSEIAQLNSEQMLLLNINTRFFVLTLFATLATQIDIALFTLGLIAWRLNASHLYSLLHVMYWWLRPIDCVINSICLYLMLDVNEAHYQMMCKGMDAYIRLCCKRIARKRIKKKYDKESISLQLLE